MRVKILVALVALAAVLIGLTLPGPPAHHKGPQASGLQTLELRRS